MKNVCSIAVATILALSSVTAHAQAEGGVAPTSVVIGGVAYPVAYVAAGGLLAVVMTAGVVSLVKQNGDSNEGTVVSTRPQ